ncbi:MAG: HAMP domain-containing sensor histidine kinase [Pseudomonadota bacterium]
MSNKMRRPLDLQWRISAVFIAFGVLLALGLAVQARFSQQLMVHPLWEQILQSTTQQYITSAMGQNTVALPTQGAYRAWHLKGSTPPGAIPADMPAYLAQLPPGYYSEHDLGPYDAQSHFAALVTAVADGRFIAVVDMTEIENLQNHSARVSLLFVLANLVLVGAAIVWLHGSLRKPARSLAQSMEALDPEQPSQRLAVAYQQGELHAIAVQTNRHLDRVERFMERERSLLDQASHEFRTPIAVISGAVDVLVQQGLPPQAQGPLARIRNTVDELTETMRALLYLSREPDENDSPETTRVDALLPALLQSHAHLLDHKPAQFVLRECAPTSVNAPPAMVSIVLANLLRNAAENTQTGDITVSLSADRFRVTDAGGGFDAVQSARDYSASLQKSMKAGGGRGLGLFLTRRICERFRWTLTLHSAVNSGTEAEVYFPPSD